MTKIHLNTRINLNKIFIIHKGEIAFALFCLGILLGILGSLQPIFMWKFASTYSLLACFPIILAIGISRNLSTPIFNRKDYIAPLVAYIILQVAMKLISGSNINGYIELLFNIIIIYGLFSIDIKLLEKLSNIICIIFGGFLIISLFFFALYIVGFPLPSTSIAHPALDYTYMNYYFFLIDDRQFMVFLPRFNSLCLEPGHLGTVGSLLLLTQLGKWKKWYNIAILVATMMTFSLAAYVLLVLILFVGAWVKGKNLLPSFVVIILLLTSVFIASKLYNDGDNLVNTLILERLEVTDDGDISGNNRVTDEFQAEYNKFITTSDVILGRGNSLEKFGFGNAGYKVFLYDYGLVSTLLVMTFYIIAIIPSKKHRAKIGMFIIFLAGFWVRAIPLYYYFMVPLYIFAYIGTKEKETPELENITENKQENEQLSY